MTTFELITDPNNFGNTVTLDKREAIGKEIAVVKNLKGTHYILV